MSKDQKIFIVRHGECLSNTLDDQQWLPLNSEDTLTKKGEIQASMLGEHFFRTCSAGFQGVIYSSPMARAKQTAEIIAKTIKGDIIYDSNLQERDSEISKSTRVGELKALYMKSHAAPNMSFGGLQSVATQYEKLSMWKKSILDNLSLDPVVVVCHGGVADILLILLAGAEYSAASSFYVRLLPGHFHELAKHSMVTDFGSRLVYELTAVNISPERQ